MKGVSDDLIRGSDGDLDDALELYDGLNFSDNDLICYFKHQL